MDTDTATDLDIQDGEADEDSQFYRVLRRLDECELVDPRGVVAPFNSGL